MEHPVLPAEISLLQESHVQANEVSKEAIVDIISVSSDDSPTPVPSLTGPRVLDVVDLQTEPAEEVFNITLLDCIMPQMYIPITCVYRIDDGVDKEAVISDLCSGLKRLLGDYRFLAGSLFETDAGTSFVKRGVSQAKHTVHVEDHIRGNFPSFDQLAEHHFPVTELDTRMLPPGFKPENGDSQG
ncbi:hypothetical protein diail_7333 [Diaporthe ilicicola]|nr:hypothetical protein diail_7333 [Diaporthe ilicicola]